MFIVKQQLRDKLCKVSFFAASAAATDGTLTGKWIRMSEKH